MAREPPVSPDGVRSHRDRFHPGMSTEFLARMGELVADSLKARNDPLLKQVTDKVKAAGNSPDFGQLFGRSRAVQGEHQNRLRIRIELVDLRRFRGNVAKINAAGYQSHHAANAVDERLTFIRLAATCDDAFVPSYKRSDR